MIEIFKTNVQNERESFRIMDALNHCFPDFKINFDLSDCDNILRIESAQIDIPAVLYILKDLGVHCELLVD